MTCIHSERLKHEEMIQQKPSWKNTLRGDGAAYITRAAEVAKEMGYTYFTWRSKVYRIDAFDPESLGPDNTLLPKDFGNESDLK
jgi:hypothetical protein